MVKNKKFNDTNTILISLVLISLFFTAAVLVVYFTTLYNADHVPYQKCNAPGGEFALEHNAFSGNVKNQCGQDRKSPCIKVVNNLGEAVKYCNLYSEICDRFMHTPATNTVSIVDLKGQINKSNLHNLYTRQIGISYEGTGKNKNATNQSGYSDDTSLSTILIDNMTSLFSGTVSTTTTSTGSGGGGYSTGSGGGGGGGGGGSGGGGGY